MNFPQQNFASSQIPSFDNCDSCETIHAFVEATKALFSSTEYLKDSNKDSDEIRIAFSLWVAEIY